jgi:DNA repair photolyase
LRKGLYKFTVLCVRRTLIGKQSLKGRGALSNPPGRFDKQTLEAVDDGWFVEESPDSIATTLEPDRAREVITTNDSPDIGFDQSINPYRGCEHACSYCALPSTPVLLADGSLRAIGDLNVGDAIYGTERRGSFRRYIATTVLARWSVIKPAYRITLFDGTELTVGGDHRFLTDRGWKHVTGTEQGRDCRPHLTVRNKLMGIGGFARAVPQDDEYRSGYLCALIRGDGTLGTYYYRQRSSGRPMTLHGFRLALCDTEPLLRARAWLAERAIHTAQFAFASGSKRPMQGIRAASCDHATGIRELSRWPAVPTRSWQAGFLAGLFDAEGSYSCGILRTCNTDPEIVGHFTQALRTFAFQFAIEPRTLASGKPIDHIRIVGGLTEHLRFFHTTDPAISRKRDFSGQAVKSTARLDVVSIEPLGKAMRLIDITTGTGDYISNGVVSHNCYARPSHAYMGLSPGLDFETRLFYKEDAAAVLEKQLARPGYVCKTIMLGANTDPYQPVERRMKVTRSILEVLLRTQHPVSVITKSALVLRDLDLLGPLARQGLASVAVSVTTLDNELKRTLEPRTASPLARLRALKELGASGVPTMAMVAPVIPAVNDAEIEAILEACAEAGVRHAAYVLLRLPYEVKDLFREWLETHYPQRAAHVMSLIRDMRGGRDNDPNFGTRMRGTGPYAELLRRRFHIACRRLGLNSAPRVALDTTRFTAPVPAAGAGAQLHLGL